MITYRKLKTGNYFKTEKREDYLVIELPVTCLVYLNQVSPSSSQAAEPPLNLRPKYMSELFEHSSNVYNFSRVKRFKDERCAFQNTRSSQLYRQIANALPKVEPFPLYSKASNWK